MSNQKVAPQCSKIRKDSFLMLVSIQVQVRVRVRVRTGICTHVYCIYQLNNAVSFS